MSADCWLALGEAQAEGTEAKSDEGILAWSSKWKSRMEVLPRLRNMGWVLRSLRKSPLLSLPDPKERHNVSGVGVGGQKSFLLTRDKDFH